MKLSHYIFNFNDDARLAKRFGITERALRSYKYEERVPSGPVAKRIIKATRGKVTCEDIFL